MGGQVEDRLPRLRHVERAREVEPRGVRNGNYVQGTIFSKMAPLLSVALMTNAVVPK